MLVDFFSRLRAAGLPVSITEYLALLEGLARGLGDYSVDEFYLLARAALVKDERLLDRFDQAFGEWYEGREATIRQLVADLPEDWLKLRGELDLTPEQIAEAQRLGSLEALMDALKERLEEQEKRHEGGKRWIGTRGTSPFGHGGINPSGVRIGGKGGQGRAAKVWEQRTYRDLDDRRELGTRNLKVALRRLRKFAREGAATELDLDDTITSTARNGGWLDIRMRPERHNAVKILLLLDVGGSMDGHIRVCEELFSAARAEFKYLEHYYFHNCVYESLWRDNRRREATRIATMEVIHRYPRDWRVIFVGDATMGPYEVVSPGGSIEHWNEEPGSAWMTRLLDAFPSAAWLNPQPERYWEHMPSIRLLKELMGERMFSLSPAGLEDAMKALRRRSTPSARPVPEAPV